MDEDITPSLSFDDLYGLICISMQATNCRQKKGTTGTTLLGWAVECHFGE